MTESFSHLSRALSAPVTGVSQRIAAGDEMYSGREKHYRSAGQSAWRCIAAALLAAGAEEPERVLDMPCGHGRVLRVLRRALPDAAITACDLDKDGVDFCAEEFGAAPVYSHEDLSTLEFESPFDLIWCGSLVTHLDAAGWLAVFRLFLRSLRPRGVAVVTFHGRWAAYRMQQGSNYGLPRERVESILEQYAATGFGYADYEDAAAYGVSLSAPAWLLRELAPWPELRVVTLAERQWDNHHDVVAVQRLP